MEFTDQNMVDFGNYLLSDDRRKIYEDHPMNESLPSVEDRLSVVNHSDLENFKQTLGLIS